jgi:hypothetical protein
MRRLLGVSPNVDEFLEVVKLHETNMGFVCLCPDCNMAKDHQFEYLTGL